MGKKRGKDKSSREEEDTVVIGGVFILLSSSSVIWAYGNARGKFTVYVLCINIQVHHADT